MALLGIVSKERRKSKTPLERAALAFDLANSVASVGSQVGGLFEQAAKTSSNPEMFDPKRYKLGTADILPEQYSAFRVRRQ